MKIYITEDKIKVVVCKDGVDVHTNIPLDEVSLDVYFDNFWHAIAGKNILKMLISGWHAIRINRITQNESER